MSRFLTACAALCLFRATGRLLAPASEHVAKQCDEKTLSELHARIADLELENKRLHDQVAKLEGYKEPKFPAAAVNLVNSTGGVHAVMGKAKLFPAPDMPSPMPGQPFVAELNLLPTDGAQGHVTVPGSNQFGQPMAYSSITIAPGKTLTYDDIAFGYNKLWADLGLWKMQRYKGQRFFQAPTDAIAIQQLIWTVKPDLLIEIGTHGGGSSLYFADIMKDYNPNAQIVTMDPDSSNIDQTGPFFKTPMIKFLNGLSTAPEIHAQVKAATVGKQKIMVVQDGMHSYDGVLQDLTLYDEFVSVGSYFVIQDTTLERAWPSAFNGAMSAIQKYVGPGGKGYGRYGIDKAYEYLLFSTNHNGYLKKINV